MKKRLTGLRAVHRHYVEEQNPPERVDHPVVRTHPETGRKSLYAGPHLTKYILDMPVDESDALLKTLFEHAARPEFLWTHVWQIGDLVMWDNRPTMHRREPFPPSERRMMKRTQVLMRMISRLNDVGRYTRCRWVPLLSRMSVIHRVHHSSKLSCTDADFLCSGR